MGPMGTHHNMPDKIWSKSIDSSNEIEIYLDLETLIPMWFFLLHANVFQQNSPAENKNAIGYQPNLKSSPQSYDSQSRQTTTVSNILNDPFRLFYNNSRMRKFLPIWSWKDNLSQQSSSCPVPSGLSSNLTCAGNWDSNSDGKQSLSSCWLNSDLVKNSSIVLLFPSHTSYKDRWRYNENMECI
jgi:hypothetical protein